MRAKWRSIPVGLIFLTCAWSQSGPDTSAATGRYFLGEVEPKPELLVDVVAPLWGRIEIAKGVFPGAWVKKDQKLATLTLELSAVERLPLDDRTVQIDGFLERAQQKLRFALADYQRAVKIREENPDFEDEVTRRRTLYENALEEFQLASRQRATQSGVVKSRDPKVVVVSAPLSGYVHQVHFTPGEVNPTDQFRRLFTLVDISSVLVRIEVFEKDLKAFQGIRRVEVKAPAYPQDSFPGTFRAIGDQVDPSTRTIPVFVEVPNRDEKLRIGLRVQVKPM